MNPSPLRTLALLGGGALLASCGPPPATHAPHAVAPASSAAPAAAPEAPYTPFADPSFLTLQNETNVYVRRALSLLWVLSAKADPPGAAREARLARASQTLSEAEAAVAARGDPCKADVQRAVERLTADKGRLERQYLSVSESDGETSAAAQSLDAQVHVLRDVLDELGVLARPCPPAMFPDSDYEPK